jgi:hypothetical protein
MSDDFSDVVKRALAGRVGYLCSNPECRALTSGPQQDPAKAVNLGVAAHITAASPGGPRYDTSLLSEQRSGHENGIWLCQNCAKLIDNDLARHTVEVLKKWRADAEGEAKRRVGKTTAARFSLPLERVAGDRRYRWVVSLILLCSLSVGLGLSVYKRYYHSASFPPITSTLKSGPQNAIPIAPASDSDQYEFFNFTPKQKARLDKIKSELFRMKAQGLDSPQYHQFAEATNELQDEVNTVEDQYKCLIDLRTLKCLPRPPEYVPTGEIGIDISTKVVAADMSASRFWLIHQSISKLKVPIVIFLSLTNHQNNATRISLVYLQAKSIGGWTDSRMADSWFADTDRITKKPLVFEARNACLSLKGEYLLPTLYDRVIQPGDKVEGWIVAEYPKGIKYGSSMGEMRISLLANNRWIESKTFNANPPVYGDRFFNHVSAKDFFMLPLDTLITENNFR